MYMQGNGAGGMEKLVIVRHVAMNGNAEHALNQRPNVRTVSTLTIIHIMRTRYSVT